MDLHYCAEPWAARYPCDVTTVSPGELEATTLAATQIVDSLSGHQFGLCTLKLRPCRASCSPVMIGNRFDPAGSWPAAAFTGPWYWPLAECATCQVGCSCSSLSQVELPYPVHDVVTVMLDGAPAATGAYRVDDHRWLVRLDGESWPACNDLRLSDTEVGTWSVTARYGQDPPTSGQYAVGEMTCEILKAFAGEDCRVPANVVQLVRQGVTIKYGDVNGVFKDGRTGLYLVDAFLEAVNPNGLRRRPRVFSVDASASNSARRVT